MKSKSTEPEASSIIFANTVLDISEKQCRDAKFRVFTRFVDNTQLISGDVYWVILLLHRFSISSKGSTRVEALLVRLFNAKSKQELTVLLHLLKKQNRTKLREINFSIHNI